MTEGHTGMKPRGPWQGMMCIFRFNWPFYVGAGVVFLAAVAGLCMPGPVLVKTACTAAIAGAGYFILVSLGVSHAIYDRSDLYRWGWLERALAGAEREHIVVCHAGFDEISESLTEKVKPSRQVILDHYDATYMTEPSIHRARRRFPPTGDTLHAPFDQWPVEPGTTDAVFALLAIHEFRSEAERTAWFREARRCLKPDGRIILAEHTRDTANFIAFGPGFIHFHSPASWRRCWAEAGLRAADEFRITPWVRIFVIIPA